MEKYDLIIFTAGPNAYAPRRIREEMTLLKKRMTTVHYGEVEIVFNAKGYSLKLNGNNLPSAKAIFIRGLGEDAVYNSLKLAIIDWYKDRGAKVINYESFKNWPSLDKVTQHIKYGEEKIPVAHSHFFGRKEDLAEWAKSSYPFIAKDVLGSCGIDVFKIKNENDLNDFFKRGYDRKTKIKTFIFQEFLKQGEDIRIIVLGGRVLGAMKRVAQKGSYLTNYSQGGDVEFYDLGKDVKAKNLALKVAKLFKLDYCGVDLMKDNNGDWIVLEVNRACQFEGFEKATGKNVAGEIADFLAL